MTKYMRAVCGRIMADVKEYGAIVITIVIYMAVVNLVFHAFCPLVIFSGFPCPGCGMTRAALCFVTGRWQRAWQLNPVIFLIVLNVVYFGWNRYFLGRRAVGIKWMLAAVMVLMVMVYVLRMYLYFPDRAPYVYWEDNVLARMLPFYRRFVNSMGL